MRMGRVDLQGGICSEHPTNCTFPIPTRIYFSLIYQNIWKLVALLAIALNTVSSSSFDKFSNDENVACLMLPQTFSIEKFATIWVILCAFVMRPGFGGGDKVHK